MDMSTMNDREKAVARKKAQKLEYVSRVDFAFNGDD